MSEREKHGFLEIFRTFWPVLLFLLGCLVWAVQKQGVSHEAFNSSEVRIALLEYQALDKKIMLKMHESQASMQTEIEQLSKAMTRIENLMFKQYGRKNGRHGND